MPLFAVTYTYVDDERRLSALRPARSSFFQRLEQGGHLRASGQLTGEAMPQGLLVLEAADATEAARLLDADPFIEEGLVTRRLIGQWHATAGTWLSTGRAGS